MITIITDGSADNRTKRGGWAAIVRSSSSLIELTGHAEETTSNRMELTAAVEGLRSLSTPSDIEVVTDSAYLCNTLNRQWYKRWFEDEERGTKTKPRPNIDLWRQLVGLTHFHNVRFIKVKGHSGDYWNERADRLADVARREKVSDRYILQDWAEGIRCDETAPSGSQCKLHANHSGPHYRSNGNGVAPYGNSPACSH